MDAKAKSDTKYRMRDSRKFRAVLIAILVYGIPIVMIYTLVLKSLAKVEDLVDISKWMGGALSPVFAAYIGGVAWEKSKSQS